MKRHSAGFTIVEVMLVLTVIGILVAIAIPVYQNYATRARVSEGLAFAAPARRAVDLFYATNGSLPSNNIEAGLDDPASMNSAAVESVAILVDGVVRVTLRSPGLAGHTLSFTPQADDSLNWSCSSTLPLHLLPAGCSAQP